MLCIKCWDYCDTIIGSIVTLAGAAGLDYETTEDTMVIKRAGSWLVDLIHALVGHGWYSESRKIEIHSC